MSEVIETKQTIQEETEVALANPKFFKILYLLSFSNLIDSLYINGVAINWRNGMFGIFPLYFTVPLLIISIAILFFVEKRKSITFKECSLWTKIFSLLLLVLAIYSSLSIFLIIDFLVYG